LRPILVVATALAAMTARTTHAQDNCTDESRGPVEVTPSAGGTNVRLDAPLRVRYSERFFTDFAGALDPRSRLRVELCDSPACDEVSGVAGEVEVVGDDLFFVPTGGWAERSAYRGNALGLDVDLDFNFRTGSHVDEGPPSFGEIIDARSAFVETACNAPDGGYRIEVDFEPATDDGPPGDLEYFLYQTHGPELEAPLLRERTRNFATNLISMAFVLRPEDATAPICVVVHATDGVGNIDADGATECFDPIQGNFFEPLCSAAPASAGSAAGGIFLLAAAGVLGARRRRRRS
jgi:MYXO-CTERM domain-containing protein